MKQIRKKEEKRIEKILIYRARGFSYHSIAKIFKLTTEGVRQIVMKSREYPQFNKLNIEIENTQKFLNRKLNI